MSAALWMEHLFEHDAFSGEADLIDISAGTMNAMAAYDKLVNSKCNISSDVDLFALDACCMKHSILTGMPIWIL